MSTSDGWRAPSASERKLIEELARREAGFVMPKSFSVRSLVDQGMGSLEIRVADSPSGKPRHFGRQVSTLEFSDADGQLVSAALNIDTDGYLFELDIFKGDFSPLLRLPEFPAQ